MNKNNLLLILALVVITTSCQRIDSNLYNPSKIKAYYQDAYTGDVDFKIDADSTKIASRTTANYKFFLYSQDSVYEKEPTYINAVYLGNLRNINNDTVILYCHGNKDHMDFYWPRAKLLANINGLDTFGFNKKGGVPRNYGVLMLDYRGFGLSPGKPSERGMYADVNAALSWLKANGCQSKNLIMYGFSLGCAPVCKLASDGGAMKPGKIILEAPFASAEAMVQDASALNMPASYFTDLVIDNSEKIKNVKQPLMWIHGTKDDFLEMETHGQLVYDNHKGAYKEAHKIEGAGHSTIQTTWGFKAYNKAVIDFIRRKQ
jgi:pimeloyl-ACP methyl ester carboxylesterase